LRRRRTFVLLSLLALSAVDASAWGPTGHRAIGQIASRQLSEETRRDVLALLDGASLAEASTWMDDVRADPRYDWLEPLHYVNLDPRAGRFDSCPERGCVVDALREALRTLRTPSAPRADRIRALRLVAHLVGDLHQPLHVAHRADRGGNDVAVEWFGQPSNLHWVWDNGVLRDSGRWLELADRLTAQLRDVRIAREAERWRGGEPVAWAHESYRLTVEVVYPSAPAGSQLGRDYQAKYAPLAERQLLIAGVRLAAVLEAAFR
jgi:S1/P1 Nuclease